MAKIQEPTTNGFDIGALAPAGTYVATCLDIEDQFGVDRPKFENPQETEKLDVTRFLFGFRGQDNQSYKVQSFEFRISGSPKSNLIKFLTSWLGNPPKYGWDYCELKGQGAMITVAHKQSRDLTKTYANIVGISPVIDQLKAQVLPLEALEQAQAPAPGTQVSKPAPQQPQAPMSTATPQAPYNQPPQSSPQPSAPSANSAVNPPQQPQSGSWNPNIDSPDNCPF